MSTTTWTEPPWCGWIETTGDALLILEAARRGLIPRVTRRLIDSERKMIASGSVFVFDEDESGIRRWTDGFYWSPSRILGNFLLYRETDKRGSGSRGAKPPETPSPADDDANGKGEGLILSRPKSTDAGVDKARERNLMGSLTNTSKFKQDGLMKKTFSVNINGVAQHLISYYRIEDVESGRLRSPSSLPELASLDISPEYLDKTHFRNPPKVETDADGVPRYRGEADDIETSASIHAAAMATCPPLLSDEHVAESSSKRQNRYEPYGTSPVVAPKRPRRNTPKQHPQPEILTPKASETPSGAPSYTDVAQQPTAASYTPYPTYHPQTMYYPPPPTSASPTGSIPVPPANWPGYATAPPGVASHATNQPGPPSGAHIAGYYYPPPGYPYPQQWSPYPYPPSARPAVSADQIGSTKE